MKFRHTGLLDQGVRGLFPKYEFLAVSYVDTAGQVVGFCAHVTAAEIEYAVVVDLGHQSVGLRCGDAYLSGYILR